MDWPAILALLVAGLAMGAVNNLAGAGGVIGLFALEEAAVLPSDQANTTMRLSALAIGAAGFLGFRTAAQPVPGRAWLFGVAALPGAVAGALLAVTLPVVAFRVYLALALLALLFQQLHRSSRNPRIGPPPPRWLGALGFFLVGAHMGFVQIGTGLVAILVLAAVLSRDLVQINAAKTAVVVVSSGVAVLLFAVQGVIAWAPALWLALGCGVGSFLASRWSVQKGHGAVRVVVLLITVLALARLCWQIATGA